MKLLTLAVLATLAAAELSPCITECAQNVSSTNATACPSKNFESQECLCEYGFTSAVRKCMYTGCSSEVNDWVGVYRGAACPEGTYSATNGTNPSSNSTGTTSASGAAASSPSVSPVSTAAAIGAPVLGAAFVAAVAALL
ncbi:hypothetical protein CcaverHIS002_0301460 [Cutaneotrichosporon cavernicola]|uniref:CFEM domain-containing protein n=1 Tax=Cutaneotrichosporon cavernicola TaxID=279322 RepID=A0AA48I6A8_9TREE|nr:uncharacterized protein CcaverHIS019_0301420 [Cutaneotrichosporon cavernicola]BEI82278.1 hypothetical protein CcaverHIS002_0301460 [Cutaneotrichosporon cavernicola]BEI90072.1 hypothetical protein CcaverHIS019_0301420 [Cutaneotrichosporon cavernicola]BEI97846.1 hypothetical protein CcaverHIS631_0301450 [Cutaneotrichosporon cavernicola]BEJ05623.1 hypothetical protein CcaverHIS641_0301450 [Cutaneotrichosporon cavernicola]